ncbi:MAG: hypothetical protein EXR03_04155, partial [Pseudolabrys sp.]|nr:hypothetical protein [Pseudolabrys sp.]
MRRSQLCYGKEGSNHKTLKVGIASLEEMKKRTIAIARGEMKPAKDDPKVWFTSPESFAKVLSST